MLVGFGAQEWQTGADDFGRTSYRHGMPHGQCARNIRRQVHERFQHHVAAKFDARETAEYRIPIHGAGAGRAAVALGQMDVLQMRAGVDDRRLLPRGWDGVGDV